MVFKATVIKKEGCVNSFALSSKSGSVHRVKVYFITVSQRCPFVWKFMKTMKGFVGNDYKTVVLKTDLVSESTLETCYKIPRPHMVLVSHG